MWLKRRGFFSENFAVFFSSGHLFFSLPINSHSRLSDAFLVFSRGFLCSLSDTDAGARKTVYSENACENMEEQVCFKYSCKQQDCRLLLLAK